MKHLLNNNRGEVKLLSIFIVFLVVAACFHFFLSYLIYTNIKDIGACKKITLTDLKSNTVTDFYGAEFRIKGPSISFIDISGNYQTLILSDTKVTTKIVDDSFCSSKQNK